MDDVDGRDTTEWEQAFDELCDALDEFQRLCEAWERAADEAGRRKLLDDAAERLRRARAAFERLDATVRKTQTGGGA